MSTKNTPKKQAVKTATEKAEDTPEANSGSPGGPDDKALIAAKMKAGLSHEAAIEVIERQRAEDAKNQTDQ